MRLETDHVLDLMDNTLRFSAGKIDLIDDRHDLKVVIECKIYVGERLCLDALRCVNDENRSLARGERTGNFIVKVNMAGGVDEVEDVFFPVFCTVNGADRLCLDRDAAFPLEVHIVKDLLLHLALGQKTGLLDDAVRKRRFSVVDMRNNAEIANFALVSLSHSSQYPLSVYSDPRRSSGK